MQSDLREVPSQGQDLFDKAFGYIRQYCCEERVHLLMKDAGRLKLFAENHLDSVLGGTSARIDGLSVTPVDKGKIEATSWTET